MNTQIKQQEWHEQWEMLQDDELFLFKEWIEPHTLESLRGQEVLECGCGGGQHTAFMAPYAKTVTAVDLNTVDLARTRNQAAKNVEYVEADIATMDLGCQFDVVISIGVVHHTDDPDRTMANLRKHVKPGGRLIVWVYSQEGNFMVEHLVEPARKLLLRRLPRKNLYRISQAITAVLLVPVHTLYRLPLTFLPYYEYFKNFRRMSFERNALNVFDKLNAPQVRLISKARARGWFPAAEFEVVQILPYCGVSWRASGRRVSGETA